MSEDCAPKTDEEAVSKQINRLKEELKIDVPPYAWVPQKFSRWVPAPLGIDASLFPNRHKLNPTTRSVGAAQEGLAPSP